MEIELPSFPRGGYSHTHATSGRNKERGVKGPGGEFMVPKEVLGQCFVGPLVGGLGGF